MADVRDGQLLALMRAEVAGRGHMVTDVAPLAFVLVPDGPGIVVAVRIIDDDTLLVQTGSGTRIGIPLDTPFDPAQPTSILSAIISGGLVELFSHDGGLHRVGYRLTYPGGALFTGDDLGPVTLELPVPAWDQAADHRS